MDERLNIRIWTENGVSYFCTGCGEYRPEKDFYKSKKHKWGIDSKCKIHYRKKGENDDIDTRYLKLNRIKQSDFDEVKEFLQRIGYDTTKNIHEQFLIKHNLQNKKWKQ